MTCPATTSEVTTHVHGSVEMYILLLLYDITQCMHVDVHCSFVLSTYIHTDTVIGVATATSKHRQIYL